MFEGKLKKRYFWSRIIVAAIFICTVLAALFSFVPFLDLPTSIRTLMGTLIGAIAFPIFVEQVGELQLWKEYPEGFSVYYLGLLTSEDLFDKALACWWRVPYANNPLIHGKLDELIQGKFKALHIEAPGGCGKTTVLRRAVEMLRDAYRQTSLLSRFPNPKHCKLVVIDTKAGHLGKDMKKSMKEFSEGVVMVIDDMHELANRVQNDRSGIKEIAIAGIIEETLNLENSYFLSAARKNPKFPLPSKEKIEICEVDITPPKSDDQEDYHDFLLQVVENALVEISKLIDRNVVIKDDEAKEQIVANVMQQGEALLYIPSAILNLSKKKKSEKPKKMRIAIDYVDMEKAPKTLNNLYRNCWDNLEGGSQDTHRNLLRAISVLKEIHHRVSVSKTRWIYLNILGQSADIWVKTFEALNQTIWFSSSGSELLTPDLPYQFVREHHYSLLANHIDSLFSKLTIHKSIQIEELTKSERIALLHSVSMYYQRIMSSEKIESLRKARTCYREITSLDPEDALAWTYWGSVLGEYATAIKDPVESRKLLKKAIEKQRHAIEVIKEQRRAIDLNRYLAIAYTNWGIHLDDMGKHSEAIGKHKRAIDLDRKLTAAIVNLARSYGSIGKHQKAHEVALRAVELQPSNPIALVNEGTALLNLASQENRPELYETAIEKFEKAIDIQPNNLQALENLGKSLYNLGRYESALKRFQEAIEFNPHDPSYWYGKASSLHGLEQYEKQIGNLEKAIEIDSSFYPAWFDLGAVYLEQAERNVESGEFQRAIGNYRTAIRHFKMTIRLKPDAIRSWEGFCSSLHCLGNVVGTNDGWSRVLQILEEGIDTSNGKGCVVLMDIISEFDFPDEINEFVFNRCSHSE